MREIQEQQEQIIYIPIILRKCMKYIFQYIHNIQRKETSITKWILLLQNTMYQIIKTRKSLIVKYFVYFFKYMESKNNATKACKNQK